MPSDRSAPLNISADGSKVVYVGDNGQSTCLYVRSLNAFDVNAVPGTGNAIHPFFSPDGKSIAYFADQELRRVSLDGAKPMALTQTAGTPLGGYWTHDDRIIYCLGGSSLWVVSANGGVPSEVQLKLDTTDTRHPSVMDIIQLPTPVRFPFHLRDNYVLIAAGLENVNGVVGILDLNSGRFKPLLRGAQPRYVNYRAYDFR